MKSADIKSIAKNLIKIEAQAVSLMLERIDGNFEKAVNFILRCSGHLIVTGIGKSGLISKKISSTMSSTGTPSNYLHPGDAMHGDLGRIKEGDILLFISNSGETAEIIKILPSINKKKILKIGLVGEINSTLGRDADICIDTSVIKEACNLNLAPTASTTATLVIGDALALTVSELKGFNKNDFAENHPGGDLGKKLLLTVNDICHKNENIPLLNKSKSIKEALLLISEKGLGVVGVVDNKNKLVGIITDGDVRRSLENYGDDLFKKTAKFIMSKNPKWIPEEMLAITALEKMEKYGITSLFVFSTTQKEKLTGIVHIHDILRTGL
tara:strand:+ start:16954 stop:17931 length:978 start_codon:yes stop_codon:yes gene_type:complete